MKHQVDALTSTRGLAALLVVIFHFGCTVFPFNIFEHFFRSGNLAVGYFFVLSGFVMYYTYHNRRGDYSSFMKKRVLRIVPAYYLALILAAAYLIVQGGLSSPLFLRQLVLNATFTQAFFPGYALSVNSPGWSLSIEMFFYILFPAILLFANKNIKRFSWLVIVFFIISQVVHLLLIHKYKPVWGTAMHEFIFYFPLFHFNQFFVGMAGGYLFSQYKKRGIKYSSLLPLIVIILLVNFMPGAISLHNGLLAPLFMLLVIAVAINNPVFLRWRPLVLLGEVSYGIYIFQEPVHKYMAGLNEQYIQLEAQVFFYVYVLILVLCATISYYAIERPLRNLLNKA